MGFPEWRKVSDWLNKTISAPYPEPETVKLPDIKNPEIPALNDYEGIADDSFWKFFAAEGPTTEGGVQS